MDELSVQMPLMTFTIVIFVIGCVIGYYLGHRSAFSQFRKLLGDVIAKDYSVLKVEEKSLASKVFGFFKKVFNFLKSVNISIKRVEGSKPKSRPYNYEEFPNQG